MLQTNLLDSTVSFQLTTSHGTHEVIGTVRALYATDRLRAVVANETGLLHDVLASQLTVVNPTRLPSYAVWMFWKHEQKIKGIKAIRAVTNMGLKDAKDFIEAGGNPIRVINNLSQERAEEVRRMIQYDNGMECEVRKEV